MKRATMALVFGVCLLVGAFASAAGIPMRIADPTPRTFANYDALKIFEKEVKERSGGQIDVQIFPDAVLGDHQTTTESTLMGSIEGTVVTSAWTQNLVKEHRVFTLPFLWPNYKAYRAWLDTPDARKLGDLLEGRGLKVIGMSHTGWLGVMNSKREVKAKEDFKGLKIRTMPDSVLVDSITALGCMGVAMGPGELYSAVQQGVLDGVSTSPQFLSALKIQEVAKYYTDLKLHATPAFFFISMRFWKQLTPDQQKIVQEAGRNFEKNSDAYFVDDSRPTSDARILEVFRKGGVKIYMPTEKDMEAYRELTRPVFAKYREQVGPELVDGIEKFLKNYR